MTLLLLLFFLVTRPLCWVWACMIPPLLAYFFSFFQIEGERERERQSKKETSQHPPLLVKLPFALCSHVLARSLDPVLTHGEVCTLPNMLPPGPMTSFLYESGQGLSSLFLTGMLVSLFLKAA